MDLEEDRSLQGCRLYKNERKFLAEKQYDLEQKTKNTARRRITETRLPSLPYRIQALVDDVVLLETGGFLQSEYWADGWEELTEIQPRVQSERDSEFVDSHTWMPNTRLDNEVRLGYTIGQMLRSLSSGADTDVDYTGLGWGFILGIFGEPRAQFDREYRRTSEFLNTTIKKLSQKKERASEMDEIMEMESIEEDLSRYPSLTSAASVADRTEKAKKARAEYKHARTSDADVGYLGVLDSIFAASDEELDQARELHSQIQRTVNLIDESQSGHQSAKEVFRVVWEKDRKHVDRDSIRRTCNTSKKQVTEIMNNLGSDPSSDSWVGEPPLVEKESGRVNPEWSLTNFGYVVGFLMFEEDGAEFVYRAIGQILTDQQAQHDLHNCILNSMSEL